MRKVRGHEVGFQGRCRGDMAQGGGVVGLTDIGLFMVQDCFHTRARIESGHETIAMTPLSETDNLMRESHE